MHELHCRFKEKPVPGACTANFRPYSPLLPPISLYYPLFPSILYSIAAYTLDAFIHLATCCPCLLFILSPISSGFSLFSVVLRIFSGFTQHSPLASFPSLFFLHFPLCCTLLGSPFKFYVDTMGSGSVSAYGPGLSHGRCGDLAEFLLVTKDAGTGNYSYLPPSLVFLIPFVSLTLSLLLYVLSVSPLIL